MSLFICLIQTCLSEPLDVCAMIGEGGGREKKLERNKLMTAITKETESPSVPDQDLQSLSLLEKGTGGGSSFTPLGEEGGEARGVCWETRLLRLCACWDVLRECKGKVSNQVVYRALRWVSVGVLVRCSCGLPLSFP